MAGHSSCVRPLRAAVLALILACVLSLVHVWQNWAHELHVPQRSCRPTEDQPTEDHLFSELGALWRNFQVSTTDSLTDLDGTQIKSDALRRSLIAVNAQPTSVGPTYARTSTYKLISPLSPQVGDILHFHIQANDIHGRRRTNGGDFWFGVLESPKVQAATAARIVDHHNGTYSMYFLAGWAGLTRVKVILVHPSEAIQYLRTSFRHADKKVLWKGLFTSHGKLEKSLCWIAHLGNWSSKCEYLPQRALRNTRLLCDSPPSLSCDTLKGVIGATSYAYQFERVLPGDKAYLFQEAYVNAQLKYGSSISVKEHERIHVLDPNHLDIPTCQPDLPLTLSDGFWYKNQWQSLICKPYIRFDSDHIRKCLRNQNVYLTGDSTTRQWFSELAKALGISKPEDRKFTNKSFYLERREPKENINLKFIFHPLSLHPSAVQVNLSVVEFEADVLLNLPQDSCEHIVVISPWAHFPNYPWDSYTEWLEGIRDAYLIVKQRCPKLRIIIKTPHPVNMQQEMKARDWMFYQMRMAMWKIFLGTGAIFVDIWDLNLSYPSSPINMHMPDLVIQEEVALFLSHICQS